MRPHDLRRSFAAAAPRADVMGSPLKRLMGHALADVTEACIRDMRDDLLALAQRVEDSMLAEASAPQPEPAFGKVVALRRRARAT